jgi:hypothetical protein
VIDHVNNLKLQYPVELSKLGERCADVERDAGVIAEEDEREEVAHGL